MNGRFWTRHWSLETERKKDALAQTHHLAAFGLLRQASPHQKNA